MKSCKIYLILILFFFFSFNNLKADTTKVLFIGNSYTYVNDLPSLFKNLSYSGGKIVFTDISAPGGYSFEDHVNNTETTSKIKQGIWNYVVLQEQSQKPVIDYYRYNSTYPFAKTLDSLIKLYGGQTMFYETWGRKYGGMQCIGGYCSPDFIDYYHMQDSLKSAYTQLASMLNVVMSPVGESWRLAHTLDTNITLWDSDNSHPLLPGSYLAACVFFVKVFNQSPVGLSFTGGLSSNEALTLQNIAYQSVVGISKNQSIIPSEITLEQNYPNPFNPNTIIRFQIKDSRYVTLKVYDILGREVSTLVNEFKKEGKYEIQFSINSITNNQFSSGVYFYVLTAGSFSDKKKMILLR